MIYYHFYLVVTSASTPNYATMKRYLKRCSPSVRQRDIIITSVVVVDLVSFTCVGYCVVVVTQIFVFLLYSYVTSAAEYKYVVNSITDKRTLLYSHFITTLLRSRLCDQRCVYVMMMQSS